MNLDHGHDDPLPFELGGWKHVADEARKVIKEMFGRELTEVYESKCGAASYVR